MKKTLLLLACVFNAGLLVAQPTINENSFINISASESIGFYDFAVAEFDPGNSGENVNWDFSNLQISGDTCFYEILDPEMSAFRDSFPLSNTYFICTTEDENGEKVENHTFYINSPEEVILEGNVSLSISDPDFDSIFIVYHDPQINFSFPYTYEKEHQDDYQAIVSSYIPNQSPVIAIQEGTITTKADAYGTVKTAAGEFKDAMRIYRFEDAENSIPGIPFSSPQESHRYTWLAENENYLALNLDQTIVKDFNGNVVSTSESGFFRKRPPGSMTNATAPSIEISNVQLFPNPTPDFATLTLESKEHLDLAIVILSISGRMMKRVELGEIDRGVQQLDIDLSDLTKGTYLVQVRDRALGNLMTLPVTLLR